MLTNSYNRELIAKEGIQKDIDGRVSRHHYKHEACRYDAVVACTRKLITTVFKADSQIYAPKINCFFTVSDAQQQSKDAIFRPK